MDFIPVPLLASSFLLLRAILIPKYIHSATILINLIHFKTRTVEKKPAKPQKKQNKPKKGNSCESSWLKANENKRSIKTGAIFSDLFDYKYCDIFSLAYKKE